MKSDANAKEIVQAFRDAGATVVTLELGRRSGSGGVPDLLCGYNGKTFLVEIKVPGEKLKQSQREFWAKWKGSDIRIATTKTDVDLILLQYQ